MKISHSYLPAKKDEDRSGYFILEAADPDTIETGIFQAISFAAMAARKYADQGCTFSALLIDGDRLCTFHAGDSPIYAKSITGAPQCIIRPHDGYNEKERSRVVEWRGSIVETSPGPGRKHGLYLKTTVPGSGDKYIALTRSWGDSQHEPGGLIHAIDTQEITYQTPLYLALCSDGILDKAGDAVSVPSPDADDFTDYLNDQMLNPSAEAVTRWAKKRGSEDDITAITIELSQPLEQPVLAFVMDGHFGQAAVEEAGCVFARNILSALPVKQYKYSHLRELSKTFTLAPTLGGL